MEKGFMSLYIRKILFILNFAILQVSVVFPLFSLNISEVDNANNFIHNPNLPIDSTAAADDITSMYFNPAGIGIHPLQIGMYYGNNSVEKLQDYLVFLNLFGLAFSSQWRQTDPGFNAQKFTVGTGFEASDLISIGTTYNWYHSNSSILNNYTEWDVGLIFRPIRWLSFGTVARGLNIPVFQNVQIKPRLDAGIALRLPISKYTERFTLSADATFYFDKRIDYIIPRLTAEVIPLNGFTLYGGTVNFQDYFFGLKLSQNITQISFQGSIPRNRGQTYSGGVLISQERYKTQFEAIQYYLQIPLNDHYQENKKSSVMFLQESISFYDLIASIQSAVNDPQIRGIIIKADNFSGGWAQAEELRNSLLQFQEISGKPVYAFIESGGNKEYYIATAAERIIMPPAGTLQLNGLQAEVYYLRGLLDLVGVEPDFIAIGDYKSAPHMFTNKNPDKYEKEQITKILTNIQNELKRGILTRRKEIKADELDKLFDQGFFSVNMAKKAGFIDDVMYFPEIKEKYLKVIPTMTSWKIDLKNYIKTKLYNDSWGQRPAVAVLTLEGEINSDESNIPFLGDNASITQEKTIQLIEKIKINPLIKSVVIRINSPGGSSLTSDILWKEIRLLQETKPVVISLGNTAASGGYYLAVGADEILADQTSITGSIGVYFGKFSLKNLYKKLGIHKEVYKIYQNGAIFSETDVFSKEEKKLLQNQMIEFYDLFIDRIQRSRTSLTKENIEENANGQVYTGADAQKKGMVDKIGGLSLAIEIAKHKGNIKDDYMNVLMFPNNTENILSNNKFTVPLPNSVKSAIKILSDNEKTGSSDKILFLMPLDIDIH
ncbi:MAG: signal peptide peptidase SppA [Spirochaetia bacterium]|nr:signal peptide peptidase SppA [Spirochaetia bacterium]